MATFVRRDIWSLDPTDDVPLWYARAVGEMKGRPADNPLSWTYQAAMHGTYTRPADSLWNGCQHASWFFLPWHRIYIWFFEQIVRDAIVKLGGPSDWALPYWNYTDSSVPNSDQLPLIFREPELDGEENPLFVGGINRSSAVNAGAPIPIQITSTKRAMDSLTFSPGFGGLPKPPTHSGRPHGLLESQPHDLMHGAVGGDVTVVGCHEGWMSDPNCAAADPIFFLHHSNIDRLWVQWLGKGDGRTNPQFDEWITQPFSCFGADGKEHAKTCGEVADILKQDYRYDDMPAAPAPVAAPPPAAAAPPAEAELPQQPGKGPEIAVGGGAELGATPAVVELHKEPDAVSVLDAAKQAAADEGPRVYLHLEGVDAAGVPGVIWDVRLDPDGEGGDPERTVGAIGFFGRGHAHGDDPEEQAPGVHDERFIFDITDVVRELEAEGRWNEDAITVSFNPVAPEGVDVSKAPAVSVKRVYITHG